MQTWLHRSVSLSGRTLFNFANLILQSCLCCIWFKVWKRPLKMMAGFVLNVWMEKLHITCWCCQNVHYYYTGFTNKLWETEYTVHLIWYRFLMTPNGVVLFFYSRVGMKDFCLKDTDTEDSNWAVISPFTDQSAAPVMMLCYHAMQTNYIFLCRKMPKICNNSYSIMDNSLHVSAIIEMQCTLTLTYKLAY